MSSIYNKKAAFIAAFNDIFNSLLSESKIYTDREGIKF